jgi:hypothetical protein
MSLLFQVFTSCPKVQKTLLTKVSHLHVIFDLNGVLVVKHAYGFHTRLLTNSLLTFMPGLKDFLTSCLVQFEVYIWSTTQHYNINKYLDKIKEKTLCFWIFRKFLDKNVVKKMIIFLLLVPKS